MRKDFTSASGTAKFQSGRGFNRGIKYINCVIHLNSITDQTVLMCYLKTQTGYEYYWNPHVKNDGIIYVEIHRCDLESIKRICNDLAITFDIRRIP